MTCAQCQELLPGYLTGDETPSEREAVRAHLAGGCPECAGAMVEVQAAFALVGLSLEPMTPPAEAKARLMARLRAMPARRGGSGGASTIPVAADRGRRPWWLGAVAVAACAALVALGAWHIQQGRENAQRIAALRQNVAERDARFAQLQSLVTTNQLSLIALGGQAPQPKSSGRVFWDKDSGRWHAFFFDMKPPPPGKEYELWFITADEKKVPAGTFGVDAQGNGELVVEVPPGIGPLALAAVTDEPLGGAPQPTGAIQLVGKAE